jgi:hypothetical protein
MRIIREPVITAFETALLDALLAGLLEILVGLREQARHAEVVSRELSGAGFFLNFAVPATVRRVEPLNFEISDVYFDLRGTDHGGGSALFVRDGAISMLEGYSHAGDWPDEPEEFILHYFDGAARNLGNVIAEILSPRGTPDV